LEAPHDQPGFKAVDLAGYCRPFELVNISAGKDSIVAWQVFAAPFLKDALVPQALPFFFFRLYPIREVGRGLSLADTQTGAKGGFTQDDV
jgi:hypothetical protein